MQNRCYKYINLVWLQHNLVKCVFFILDQSDQVLSSEGDTSSNNSNSPRFIQLTSQTTGLNSEKLDIYKEEQASLLVTAFSSKRIL